MATMNASDPFFSLTSDSDWRACIGRQGDEEDYVEGYMQAALELASAVIDKQQYAKRDTLAMPILYNARHAVELTLKFTTKRLHAAGVISALPPRRSHDIMVQWTLLHEANLGDSEIRNLVAQLNPFVHSLHRVDADGQQLRYSETRDGRQSLFTESICDLEVIRASLEDLNRLLSSLMRRALSFIEERGTGTFTGVCSRKDLFQIAQMLPARDRWSTVR